MLKGTERVDIIIEAIEVFLNQILYLRDMYPAQIFKKRRAYNCPVYASIFPPLNTYVHNVLRSAKDLLNQSHDDKNGDLKQVELIFYTGEDDIFERHLFEVFDESQIHCTADDAFLLYFEEELRKSLYEMPERMKLLKKLPHETKMAIRLHTSQSGHIRLSNDGHLQDFPWLLSSDKSEKSKKWYLLPLATVHKMGLSLITEVVGFVDR